MSILKCYDPSVRKGSVLEIWKGLLRAMGYDEEGVRIDTTFVRVHSCVKRIDAVSMKEKL